MSDRLGLIWVRGHGSGLEGREESTVGEFGNLLLGFWWRAPLVTAQGVTAAMGSLLGGHPCTGQTPLRATVSAAAEQLGGALREVVAAGDQVQMEAVNVALKALTLEPLWHAARDNLAAFRPPPEVGSQKQPELDYLRAITDAGPAGLSLIVLALATLYSNLNRQQEGVDVFQGYLARHGSRMEPWQQAAYRSALALLLAGAAKNLPLWNVPGIIALAQAALRAVTEAKAFALAEPDFGEQNARLIVWWTSGLLNAQLPPPLGNREVALADLHCVVETVTSTPQRHADGFIFLREAYYQLALLYRRAGRKCEAQAYLELSKYDSFDKNIQLATFLSCTADGLRPAIKHVTESGEGSVFTVAGHDMSEFNYVLSKDRRYLIAIDCGSREDTASAAYNFLRNHLRARGLAEPPPLAAVFVTHSHWDHVGGHPVYRRLSPNATFYSRSNYAVEQAIAANQLPPYRWFLGKAFQSENVTSYHPDVLVESGNTLESDGLTIGGTPFQFKLIPGGGGETPDGMLVYLPEERVLFGGDFVLPYVGVPYSAQGDTDSMLAAFEWISTIRPHVILYGHELLTRFYSRWQTLQKLGPHLSWLRREVLANIFAFKTRVAIQEMNLYPPAILHPDQVEAQLPYLLAREPLINRIYHQTVGYWGPDLEGVDYLSAAEFADVFARYLGLSDRDLARLVERMVRNGDHELGGRVADWGLARFPASETLTAARRLAYLKLKEKWQTISAFKFVMYSEHVGDPTSQLDPVGGSLCDPIPPLRSTDSSGSDT
jgi:glyoxylase-like metal-dependent hydrolase (beta-lactamase superfamily II)